MSMNLTGFVKSLLPSFDKSDLETDMEISLDEISVITESYTQLEEIFKVSKPESKEVKDLIKEFYKELKEVKPKVKLAPVENLAADTLTLMKNVKINGDHLLKEISDSVNDVVVSQALTAYKVNLLRSVAHYYFMTRFATDLVNFIYVSEADHAGMELTKEYKLNPKQKQFITKNLWIYARMLAVYGNEHTHFQDKLSSVGEITIPKDSVDEAVSVYEVDKIDVFNNLPQGFVGSPIYTIRMIFSQWEADRYRSMKDKKRLLELRYLHLKLMKEQNQSDINIEKEIMHLQKRLTDLDYKLAKIESDVE